jgi:hypothetical protein
LCTSCNGQVKKELPKENVSESKIIAHGQPKLVRNLGSLKDKGFNVNSSLQVGTHCQLVGVHEVLKENNH